MKRTIPVYKTKNKAVAITNFEKEDINEAISKINKIIGEKADN